MKFERWVTAAGLAIALTGALVHAQNRDQLQPPKTGKAALSGVVVTDEATPQPVKRAQIMVVSADAGPANMRTAFTNDAGRFQVTGLPAGRYTLAATKAPFLRAAYGAKRPDRPGTPITLKENDQMTDITLRLTRGGVLGGVITDENGQPAFGVSVRILQMRMQNGERTFTPVATSGSSNEITDDRGTYRFFGLPAGEYAISATPRAVPGEVRAMTEAEIRAIMLALQQQNVAQQQAAQAQAAGVPNINTYAQPQQPQQQRPETELVTVGYANVYYPGTTVAASASTLTLAPGEERTSVDFSLKLVKTARIEGTVVVPPDVRPQNVQLMLAPVASPGGSGLDTLSLNRATPGPDGKFTFTSVQPGAYTITARAAAGGPVGPPPPPPPPPGGPPGAVTMQFNTVRVGPPGGGAGEPMMVMPEFTSAASGSPYWGQADLTVDGSSVSGVTVSMQPGMTITGRIAFKGTRLVPDGDLSRVRITLTPAPTGAATRIAMGVPMAQVEANGQFRITGVTPGRYRMAGVAPLPMGSGPGAGWGLLSVIAKGRDVLDFSLDVAPNEEVNDVVVTFTDATQEVSGALQDASGRPAPDYTIVVFAADSRYWTSPTRRTRTTRPGTDGRFSVVNLPPGEYRIAAVTDVAPGEANDPAFLEQLVNASFKFTLAEGEKKAQDLRISGSPGGL